MVVGNFIVANPVVLRLVIKLNRRLYIYVNVKRDLFLVRQSKTRGNA